MRVRYTGIVGESRRMIRVVVDNFKLHASIFSMPHRMAVALYSQFISDISDRRLACRFGLSLSLLSWPPFSCMRYSASSRPMIRTRWISKKHPGSGAARSWRAQDRVPRRRSGRSCSTGASGSCTWTRSSACGHTQGHPWLCAVAWVCITSVSSRVSKRMMGTKTRWSTSPSSLKVRLIIPSTGGNRLGQSMVSWP